VLLEGFYILAKILVLYIQRLYYKKPVVLNETFAKIDKPTILVSNHPNTLLDAVFAAATVSEQVKFLANYSLFKSRVGNWFFNTFYCIPVQRPEDVKDGQTDNVASIAKSHEFLSKGGTLYVAAEGYSIQTIGIRPLKTGAARLALGTENDLDWNADIQILPIGLNYEKADRFRSNLVTHIGKPYSVKEWRTEYFSDARTTVKKVTDELEDQMRSVLLDADEDRTDILNHIRSYLFQTNPTDPKREYLRTRKLLVDLKATSQPQLLKLKKVIGQFESNCSKSKVTSSEVAAAHHDKIDPKSLINLISALPLTLVGAVLNILPYLLCHWIDKKGNKLLVYRSTFRVLAGMIFFPAMYLFWMWLVSYFTNNVILTLGSVFIYRRLGIYAWHQIKDWKRYFRSRRIIEHDPQHIDQLESILSSVHHLSA